MIKLISPRWQAAWKYLCGADSISTWRISRSDCPSCMGKYFISLRKDAFMTRCLSCGANVTNLSLIPVIKLHNEQFEINTVWEMSTYGATLKYLIDNFETVLESEYFPHKISGEIVNNTLNQDVQNLSFQDASIDLITSNQVFEHVQDDMKGFEECNRVLKKNGALIFTIPLYDIPETKQQAAIRNNEVIFFAKPDYHNSRTTGPSSVLVFWHHSFHDICERVSKAGFNARLIAISIPPSQAIPTYVIYAVKNYG